MWKPSADPIYVRAAAWPKCDLACSYCPVEEGMENRVPEHLSGERLSTVEYLRNLEGIGRAGIRGVSFTGGEPTLRPDLAALITGSRPLFDRVELTTNGAKLARVARTIKENGDLLKVSLDSFRTDVVAAITGRQHAYNSAIRAINWAIAEGVPLGINVVLMQRTGGDIYHTIDCVRQITKQATAPVYLSLLDFYYTPNRREEWLAEFLPTFDVLDLLMRRFGSPQMQERFGCSFYWFDADGLRVRLKDSFGATMRASNCSDCPNYCQEGVYGVKHSVEGWFTTCPSNHEDLGVHLPRGLSDVELDDRIGTLLQNVRSAIPHEQSFSIMCETHSLSLPLPVRRGL